MNKFLLGCCISVLVVAIATYYLQNEQTNNIANYVKEASLVDVTVYIETIAGHGSGVIIGRDGSTYFVLTSDHVIRTSQISYSGLDDSLRGTVKSFSMQTNSYAVLFDNNNDVKEKAILSILSQDSTTDLAVVSFDSDLDLPVIPLLPEDELIDIEIFTPVIAIGCQAGYAPYPTEGIFADKLSIYPLVYFTTADISYGSSGGGVFVNVDGEYYLLGISSSATIAQNGQILTHMAHTVVVWKEMELLSDYVHSR